MSWEQYVKVNLRAHKHDPFPHVHVHLTQAAQLKGFTKVTIVHRTNYNTLSSTSDADIATAWDTADGQKVNENQELLNDWKDKKRPVFYFYGKKFNIVLRDDENGNFLVCSQGKEVCIARQFKTIWFIALGETSSKDKKDKGKKKNAFSSASTAWNTICTDIFDGLEDSDV